MPNCGPIVSGSKPVLTGSQQEPGRRMHGMRKGMLVAVCVVSGCGFQTPAENPDGDDTAAGVDAAVDDTSPDAPAADDPTAGVDWYTWPEQQPTFGSTSYGTALIDIGRHLPASYGTQYWDSDAITAGHETTHGIQAHLRNYKAPMGPRV